MAGTSTYTQEVADIICEQLAEGYSLRQITAMDGIPSQPTVFRWIADNESFRKQYASAREAQAEKMADEILAIADCRTHDVDEEGRVNHEVVARDRLRVDSRKWLLSKLAPKKYGDKLAIGGAEDLPALQVDLALLPSDAYKRMLEGK